MFQGLGASRDNHLLARSVLVLFVQVCVLCPRPLVAAFLTRKTCRGVGGLAPERDEMRAGEERIEPVHRCGFNH